jgi:tetratricopeptide (TPR) repeat protein
VRLARGALLGALLVAALWPERSRYHAERELRAATDALRYVLTHPGDFPDPAGALDRIALVAAAAQAPLPGDPRPVVLEGSARLIQGDAQRAREVYRRALSLGERAETDLNLARAYERLGREPEARATFLRAAWVSPVLLRAMLPDVAATAAAEMARLEKELKAGKLSAPPPLPE